MAVADGASDALQDLALAVLVMLHNHGAVEIEKDGIEGTQPHEIVRHHAHDPLEGIFRDMGRRFGRGPQQRHELVAIVGCLADEGFERARLRPDTASNSAGPRVNPGQASCSSKSAKVALVDAKVFVSC